MRGLTAVVATSLVMAAAPAHADPVYGGQAYVENQTLYFKANPLFANHVEVHAAAGGKYVVTDSHAIQAGIGCAHPDSAVLKKVVCDPVITAIQLDGGDGDDTLDVKEPMATMLGGPGNDKIVGSTSTNTMDGGHGDDLIVTDAAGADVMIGGAGYDTVQYFGDSPIQNDTITTDVEHIIKGVGVYNLSGTAAGEVKASGSRLSFVAASGHANAVSITNTAGANVLSIKDQVRIIAANGCVHPNHADLTKVSCAGAGIVDVKANGGDRNDHLINFTSMPSILWGDAGDDTLDGGPFGTGELNGGPGTDTCTRGRSYTNCNP